MYWSCEYLSIDPKKICHAQGIRLGISLCVHRPLFAVIHFLCHALIVLLRWVLLPSFVLPPGGLSVWYRLPLARLPQIP